jgi:hypothetical protein
VHINSIVLEIRLDWSSNFLARYTNSHPFHPMPLPMQYILNPKPEQCNAFRWSLLSCLPEVEETTMLNLTLRLHSTSAFVIRKLVPFGLPKERNSCCARAN